VNSQNQRSLYFNYDVDSNAAAADAKRLLTEQPTTLVAGAHLPFQESGISVYESKYALVPVDYRWREGFRAEKNCYLLHLWKKLCDSPVE